MGYPDSGCIQLHSATFLNNRSLIAIGFAALFMAAARCDLARFLCHPTIVGSTIPFGQNHFEFPSLQVVYGARFQAPWEVLESLSHWRWPWGCLLFVPRDDETI